MILTIAMLMTAVAAFAEGKGGPMGGPQPGQAQQGPQGGRGEQPPEKPADGQAPSDGHQPPRKPDAAPEKPTGEKPADAPEGGQRRLGEAADALFTLCFPAPRAAGDLMRRSPCVER
jgi:hypothetical protein